MYTISLLSKEALVYSSLIIAGTIFVIKNLFGRRKINKTFYDKSKRKISTRSKLFFNVSHFTKNVELKQISSNAESVDINEHKFLKIKKIVEKISKDFDKSYKSVSETKDEKKEEIHNIPTKKDQIFYYLLNNISHMVIENQKKD